MKKTTALLLLLLAGFLPLPQTAWGGEAVRVVLNNRDFSGIYVVAYDATCGNRVYEGRLAARASLTITVCQDRHRRGGVVVYDRRGRNNVFRNLRSPASVFVDFSQRGQDR